MAALWVVWAMVGAFPCLTSSTSFTLVTFSVS